MKKQNIKNGSILIEVLIAITILSIGLTLVIRAFISSLRANVYTKDYSIALVLLENKMQEYLRGIMVEGSLNEEMPAEEPFDRFHYQLKTSSRFEEGPLEGLDKMTLSILWSGHKRNNRIDFQTLLYDKKDEEQ